MKKCKYCRRKTDEKEIFHDLDEGEKVVCTSCADRFVSAAAREMARDNARLGKR